ncbi:MAG: ATP-binding cassette domain-containing protein [Prevotella sp.]|jgi:lipopolysaccharide transport system ATP-binding protein|nr:ATP-binding cassette domain-containing protein [Prevotella sp.]
MSDIAISFENISKQYRLGLIGTGTITHDLNRWWHVVRGKEDPYLKIGEVNDRSTKAAGKYVWALKDITFDVKQGEVLGIIGKNGAGKSTLLKILSRVTSPTTGSIKAKGRIASLLEVGTGFHPEMTGRENIFMNGAIMGMTKAEIKRKLDEIVDFAGVEKYIDTPVKRYSSGMTVRLGFAIAAHLEPEILVVDEVLAVGDAEFQKKAIGKMQDVSRGEGRTVLFVSHNLDSVATLCNSCILLENGKTIAGGKPNEIIATYLNRKRHNKTDHFFVKNENLPHFKEIQIKTSGLFSTQSFGDPLSIELKVNFPKKIDACEIAFCIVEQDKETPIVYNWYSSANQLKTLIGKEGIQTIQITIPHLSLYKGNYYFEFYLSDPRGKMVFHKIEDFFPFEVNMVGIENEWGFPNNACKYIESTICEIE